jgi:hypothetical protein
MSQGQQQPVQVFIQAQRSNGLGVAGFVVSLISFFCCGLTAPIGLIFSLIAILSPPRGMAFAGAVLGALGSWWLFAFGLSMLGALVMPAAQASKAAVEKQHASQAGSRPAEPAMIELPLPTVAPPSPAAVPPDEGRSTPTAPEPPPMPAIAKVESPKVRTWTSGDGKFRTEAEFKSMGGGSVKLRKPDGSEINVPLEKLSDEDRRWIDDYRGRRK